VEGAKGVLGSVWDTVVDGAQNVAHIAADTLHHTAEVAGNVGHTVVDAALGVKDAAIEKTGTIVHTTIGSVKDKAATLTEQTVNKTSEIYQVASDLLEAGKERAAHFTEQAVAQTEGVRQVAGDLLEAGKHKLSDAVDYAKAGVQEKAGGMKRKADEVVDTSKGTASKAKTAVIEEPKTRAADDVPELFEKTHGDEVDITGHVVIAPENVKEGPASEYEGGWEKVGKHGAHAPTGTPAK